MRPSRMKARERASLPYAAQALRGNAVVRRAELWSWTILCRLLWITRILCCKSLDV